MRWFAGLFLAALVAVNYTTPRELLPQTLKIAVDGDKAFGSGTVIGYRDGKPLVLTCAHVVGDSPAIMVSGHPGHTILKDASIDLAVVLLDDHVVYPVAKISSWPLEPGDAELVVGYPLSRYEGITRGYFSEPEDEVTRQGSAPVYPGNSGGGVYVWHWFGGWQLAGVADAVAVSEFRMLPYMAPNVSYSIRLSVVKKFLRRLDGAP